MRLAINNIRLSVLGAHVYFFVFAYVYLIIFCKRPSMHTRVCIHLSIVCVHFRICTICISTHRLICIYTSWFLSVLYVNYSICRRQLELYIYPDLGVCQCFLSTTLFVAGNSTQFCFHQHLCQTAI